MRYITIILLLLSLTANSQNRLRVRLGNGRIYATWSSSGKSNNINLSNGNLTFTGTGTVGSGSATMGKSTGKWYWETTLTTKANNIPIVGIINFQPTGVSAQALGSNGAGNSYAYRGNPGCYTTNGIVTGLGCTAMAVGQIISIALDCDAHTVKFYINGVLQVTVSSIGAVTWYPANGSDGASNAATTNFGQTSFTYYSTIDPGGVYNPGVY